MIIATMGTTKVKKAYVPLPEDNQQLKEENETRELLNTPH